MDNIYVVSMYRWGIRENHSYVLGVYTNINIAMEMCRKEESYRGGKYEGEILLIPVNCTEEAPYDNYITAVSNIV